MTSRLQSTRQLDALIVRMEKLERRLDRESKRVTELTHQLHGRMIALEQGDNKKGE